MKQLFFSQVNKTPSEESLIVIHELPDHSVLVYTGALTEMNKYLKGGEEKAIRFSEMEMCTLCSMLDGYKKVVKKRWEKE